MDNKDVSKGKDLPITNSDRGLLAMVRAVCARPAATEWNPLLKAHGFDMTAADLGAELLKRLSVNRGIQGFEDFAIEGTRAIEPGRPSQSLLFHAFASPRVVAAADGMPLKAFPTPAEIDSVENYVFGVRPPTLEELRARAAGAPLAIVVFAREYRPAASTVHRLHADLCFARTGVSRVGTDIPRYLPDRRGYMPLDPANPNVFRVLPCRYSAYIAAQLPGDPDNFGPMRFQKAPTVTPAYGSGTPSPLGDASRQFWVPLQKLFSGAECVHGFDLQVKLSAHHFNQKLRKVHKALSAQGFDTGWHEPDLSQSPFIYSEYGGRPLADFSSNPDEGEGLLLPSPRTHLVAAANNGAGRQVTLKVPPNQPYKSSLNITARKNGARSAPEYVHVRHRYAPALPGGFENLNDQPDVAEIVGKGGYEAVSYVDFTADGWIEVSCPQLRLQLPQTLPAFSMVSAPHFFPLVDELELMQWWEQSAPPDLGPSIWPKNPGRPLSLCEMRYPANVSFRSQAGMTVNDKAPDFDNPANDQTIFDPSDGTITAIVAQLGAGKDAPTAIPLDSRPRRASMLPDGAAGVFAPGWDTSIDRTDETDPDDNGVTIRPGATFLTTYGLGSPFPEDAKLCAALSSFWPAAAPDITRTFEPSPKYATATPLPDDVLGQSPGSSPWDGIPPRALSTRYRGEVDYFSIDYGDYVEIALANRFDAHAISDVDVSEYVARTLLMARVFEAVGAKETVDKKDWAVFSFRLADQKDPDLIAAKAATGKDVVGPYAYRFEMFRPAATRINPDAGEFRRKLVKFTYMWKFFADPNVVLTDFADKDHAPGNWRALQF